MDSFAKYLGSIPLCPSLSDCSRNYELLFGMRRHRPVNSSTICQWTNAYITNPPLKKLLEFPGLLVGSQRARCCSLKAKCLKVTGHSQVSLSSNALLSNALLPLLSPNGESGWHPKMTHIGPRRQIKRDRLTILQFAYYRLTVRGHFSHLQPI